MNAILALDLSSTTSLLDRKWISKCRHLYSRSVKRIRSRIVVRVVYWNGAENIAIEVSISSQGYPDVCPDVSGCILLGCTMILMVFRIKKVYRTNDLSDRAGGRVG